MNSSKPRKNQRRNLSNEWTVRHLSSIFAEPRWSARRTYRDAAEAVADFQKLASMPTVLEVRLYEPGVRDFEDYTWSWDNREIEAMAVAA